MSDAPGATAVRPPKRGRYPQTALALVGAIIGCLGIVAFLVLIVVRPDGATREPTDWHAAAEGAIAAYGDEILDPQLPEGWTANYARIGAAGDAATWEVGFLAPSGGYIGLMQTISEPAAAATALTELVGEATGTVRVDGREWTVFDRRALDPTGNYAFNVMTALPGSLVLLHGTASEADFAILTSTIGAEVAR